MFYLAPKGWGLVVSIVHVMHTNLIHTWSNNGGHIIIGGTLLYSHPPHFHG